MSKAKETIPTKDPWTLIPEKEFMTALEVLPPEKWKTVNSVEIFRMCEYLYSDITAPNS